MIVKSAPVISNPISSTLSNRSDGVKLELPSPKVEFIVTVEFPSVSLEAYNLVVSEIFPVESKTATASFLGASVSADDTAGLSLTVSLRLSAAFASDVDVVALVSPLLGGVTGGF